MVKNDMCDKLTIIVAEFFNVHNSLLNLLFQFFQNSLQGGQKKRIADYEGEVGKKIDNVLKQNDEGIINIKHLAAYLNIVKYLYISDRLENNTLHNSDTTVSTALAGMGLIWEKVREECRN